MQVRELEELDTRLRGLRDRLRAEPRDERALDIGDPLVRAAQECDFMLPEHLTVRSLSETVERKIGNVGLLLQRARGHEELPESAQLAAGQEYMAGEDDYRAIHPQPEP